MAHLTKCSMTFLQLPNANFETTMIMKTIAIARHMNSRNMQWNFSTLINNMDHSNY